MPDPASHLYDVAIDVDGVRGDTLPLQLPSGRPAATRGWTSPGTSRSSASTDADGRALRWDKTNGSRWVVQTGGARAVHVRYRVFANALSGTFSVLDTAHANWNGASLFMYVEGHKPDPVTLDVDAARGLAHHQRRHAHRRPDATSDSRTTIGSSTRRPRSRRR